MNQVVIPARLRLVHCLLPRKASVVNQPPVCRRVLQAALHRLVAQFLHWHFLRQVALRSAAPVAIHQAVFRR